MESTQALQSLQKENKDKFGSQFKQLNDELNKVKLENDTLTMELANMKVTKDRLSAELLNTVDTFKQSLDT